MTEVAHYHVIVYDTERYCPVDDFGGTCPLPPKLLKIYEEKAKQEGKTVCEICMQEENEWTKVEV